MADFNVDPGDLIIDQFPIFEDDGVTKHSGLAQPADFDVTVWNNAVPDTTPVTIAEIGSSGEYKLSYTPAQAGFWKVEIFVPFSEDFIISTAAVGLGASLSGVKSDLREVLGLLHKNAIVDQQTYDVDGQLLTARLRVFNNPLNVPASPGGSEGVAQGMIYQYQIIAQYTGENANVLY